MANFFVIRSVVVLLAIFVTGLLAGVMLGVAMEQQTAQKLPEAAWTLRQQNDDALFRKVMPFTFIAMMILLIASIFLLHGRSRMAMVAPQPLRQCADRPTPKRRLRSLSLIQPSSAFLPSRCGPMGLERDA
jgi:hypothetical protein